MSTETRLPFEKKCPKCRGVKKLDDFFQLQSSKDGYMRLCKTCHFETSRQNIEQEKRHSKRSRIRKKMREAKISEKDISDFLDMKYPTIKKSDLR